MKLLLLILVLGCQFSTEIYSQRLPIAVDTFLADKVYDQYCNRLTELRAKMNTPEEVIEATIGIDDNVFFQYSTNLPFRKLIQKMNLQKNKTEQNVEVAIRYVLAKMVRECPTYAYGWGQRTAISEASVVFGKKYCDCVRDKTPPSNHPDKDLFYQKVGITQTCGSYLAKDSAYIQAAQAELQASPRSDRNVLGRNGFVSLMTTCDEMVNSFVNMTLFFIKKPMETWERNNLAPPPPPPPPPSPKKRK
jgi:hypothetical protein